RAVAIELGEIGLEEFEVRAVECFEVMIVEFRRDGSVEFGLGIMPLLKEVSGGESDFAVNGAGGEFGEVALLRGVHGGAEWQSGLGRKKWQREVEAEKQQQEPGNERSGHDFRLNENSTGSVECTS